jgi:hypothetical protein
VGRPSEEKIVVAAAAAGAIAALTALALVGDPIPGEFFAVAAQVFPVFLVALAVEQRLSDRLGKTEDQYVREVDWALGEAVRATMLYENGETEEATRLMDSVTARRTVGWAANYADQSMNAPESIDIDELARSRYRERRAGEIVLVLTVITIIVTGEVFSLIGVVLDGTGPDSAWFVLTTFMLITTLVAITLTAFREFLFSG